MTLSSEASWRLILTKPRKELVVNDRLRAAGCDTVCLRYKAEESRARRVRRVWKPYYPNYIFVNGPMDIVRETTFVADMVRFGDRVARVPDDVVEGVRLLGDKNQVINLTRDEIKERELFIKDQVVRVRAGPFMSFLAIIELDRIDAVDVWLDSFGGRVKATFDPQDLEIVSPQVPPLS